MWGAFVLPSAVEAHHHRDPHLPQQVGVERGPEAPPATGTVVGPVAVGGKVAGRGGEEDEAAGDDDAYAAVERTGRNGPSASPFIIS